MAIGNVELVHGNSKNEIGKRNRGRQAGKVNMGKEYNGHEIEYVPAANLLFGPTDIPGSLLPEAADGLPNLQNHNNKYNVSITDNMEKVRRS